jgi:simple sugar transport system substrate-binding protein
MSRLFRLFIVSMLALSSVASFSVATAQESDDLRFVIVSHGQAADPFWSVVQQGSAQAEEDMGVTVEYQAPSTTPCRS